MAITKAKKETITAKVREAIADATSVVFVRFSGLSVADTSAMRKLLKGQGIGYYVAKKTLIKRALGEKNLAGELPEMPGEIAIAWSKEDPTAPAREIHASAKKYKNALSIVGGVFEGVYKNAEGMIAIATIPPLNVLRGMFVNVINSPRQGFVMALDQIAKSKA